MRTTVDLDTHLLKRLRADAAKRGVSFKEALGSAVRRGLEMSEKPAHAQRYVMKPVSMGASLINIDKAMTIAGELEDDAILEAMRRFEEGIKREAD